MIAYCGLDCTGCEAFKATASDDDALRAKVAEEWTRQFNVDIKPEYINCTGCLSEGAKIQYCESMCEIRKCARGRGHATCAACGDYPCDRLTAFFKHAPQAESALKSLKKL